MAKAKSTPKAPETADGAPVMVRATQLGFLNSLRQPGEIFMVPGGTDLGDWMELCDPVAEATASVEDAVTRAEVALAHAISVRDSAKANGLAKPSAIPPIRNDPVGH